MDQEVIYKALRGEATPGELEQVARWHAENPEEFQRCADEVHMQIDMMELYGEEIRPASWIVAHWRSVVRITVQAAAMLAIGLFVGDISVRSAPTICLPGKSTRCRFLTANA